MRKFSLRGQIEAVSASGVSEDNLIFSYESNDLTRGWKVKRFHLWFTDPHAWTGASERGTQFAAIFGKLQTDVQTSTVMDASDNREFGWLTNTYQLNHSRAQVAQTNPLIQRDVNIVMDMDHVIVRELFLTLGMYTSSDHEGSLMDISYLVEIEEFKVTPTETILQIVKGTGQSVS